MKKLLFPISLANNLFSTENLISGLNAIDGEYAEIVFVIADQIQIYNKAFECNSGGDVDTTIRKFYSGRTLFEQRRSWIDRVRTNPLLRKDNFPKWTIYGLDDIADQMFTHIYRNVLIMYNTIDQFQMDVRKESQFFIDQRNNIQVKEEKYINLSVAYILEEIAASIRLHVCEQISDEYYLGRQLGCIVDLYGAKYDINVHVIAGFGETEMNWRFFEPHKEMAGSFKWVRKASYSPPQ